MLVFAFSGCEKSEKNPPPAKPTPVEANAKPEPAPEPAAPEPEPPAPAPEPPAPEPEPEPPAPEPPAPEPPAPEPPAPEPVDRAQALGFARFIPADAEALVSFHQGKKLIGEIQRTPLWSAIESEIDAPIFDDAEAFEDPGEFDDLQGILEEDEGFNAPPTISPIDFFGTEVTLALGPESAGRVAGFLNFNRRSTYFQMRALAAAMSANGGDPEIDPFATGMAGLMFGMISEMYGDLLNDGAAIAGLQAFRMPSIYFAVRAEGDNLAAVHDMISQPVQFFSMFGEAVAPAEIEHAGNTFRGYRLIGKDIAKLLEEDRESMEESLGREPVRVLMDFISTREIVAVSGTIEDYAVAFFGSSIDDFKLAATPAESIAASPALAFADPVLNHPLHAIVYGAKGLTEALTASTAALADYADGLGDGFATHDRDGRNRDLVAMLQLVSDRERALRSLATRETTGITVVNDDGLRIDMQGGHSGMLDFTTPSRFAALADVPDTAVFFNMTTDPRHRDRSLAYQEALFQAAHTLMLRVMDVPERAFDPEDEEGMEMAAYDPFAEIREMSTLIEGDFRPHLIHLWQAVAHDMRKGLGNETAIVVDLKGTMPEIPDVPKALVENTKAPRVTMLSQVADRASLVGSWQTIQQSATHLVDRIAEMNDKEIPMPKPVHSKSDGFTTWFMPLPWFNDEFLPSVTLDDRWFAMGTSRNQALDLLGRLDALDTRSGGGLRLHVNFRVIAESQRAEIANAKAKRDAILETGEIDGEELDRIVADWESLTATLEQLDTFDIRCWQDEGLTRTRVHLRTRQ
jgi:hypothetical protein